MKWKIINSGYYFPQIVFRYQEGKSKILSFCFRRKYFRAIQGIMWLFIVTKCKIILKYIIQMSNYSPSIYFTICWNSKPWSMNLYEGKLKWIFLLHYYSFWKFFVVFWSEQKIKRTINTFEHKIYCWNLGFRLRPIEINPLRRIFFCYVAMELERKEWNEIEGLIYRMWDMMMIMEFDLSIFYFVLFDAMKELFINGKAQKYDTHCI